MQNHIFYVGEKLVCHLALCVIFMILVSLENVKKCVLGGCTITSKTKIKFFEIFSHSAGPFEAAPFEKFQKTLILAFEANSELSRKNETKIVKIKHSGKDIILTTTTYYLCA